MTGRLVALAVATLLGGPMQAAAQESTGVPACDAFLKAYEACIRARVPEPQKAEMLTSLETTRNTYRRLHTSTTLRVKPDLVQICNDSRQQTEAFMTKTYGCRFSP
jgi:hypothetical protein